MSELSVGRIQGNSPNFRVSLEKNSELDISSDYNLNNQAYFPVPAGTTNERNTSGRQGSLRYNTETNSLEVYHSPSINTDSGNGQWCSNTTEFDGIYEQRPSTGGGAVSGYVTNNLILYVDANNTASYSGSGNTWVNLSQDPNSAGNVVMSGNVQYQTFGGRNGLKFLSGSGQTSQVSFAYEITMEIVMYNQTSDSRTEYGRIVDWKDTTLSYGNYLTNQFRSWINAGGSRTNEFVVNSTESNYYNRWNHVIFTYDGSTARGFWNGVERFNQAKSGNLEGGTAAIEIGNGDGYLYSGLIGFVRVYKYPFSISDVLRNYNLVKAQYNTP